MTTRAIGLLITTLVALTTLGVLLTGALNTVEQPVAFKHALHVNDVGLECTDCHLFAKTGARATIPNFGSCADCHEEALTESDDEARLVAHIQERTPIRWQRVYHVPEDVYFSHRRHAGIAEIDCDVCHGPVADLQEPVTYPEVPISMTGCMTCHFETGASNDCIACHR